MNVIRKSPLEIQQNKFLYERCRSLSLYPHGTMIMFLEQACKHEIEASCFIAYVEDNPVGWIMRISGVKMFNKEDDILEIYVDEKWRCMGVGSKLIEAAIAVDRSPCYGVRWDETSKSFYSNPKIMALLDSVDY